MEERDEFRLDRRGLLGRAAAGAGLFMTPALLAACGDGGGASATATGAAPSTTAGGARPTSLADFKAYVPSSAAGAAPDLPKRVVYTVPAVNEYYKQIADNIELGAQSKGLDFQLVSSEGDPVKNIDLLNNELQRGVAGLVVQPEDAKAQGDVLLQAIDKGVCVIYFVTPPCTAQLIADQYELGYQQAVATVDWVKANLGGKAKVVNFTLDHIEALIPRRKGTEAGLKTGGSGIEIVVSQELRDITQDEGFKLSSTIAQAHPDVDVWIGPDDTVLGTNAYLESIGKSPSSDDIYLTGLAGTKAGKDAVAKGNTFLRSTWGFNDPLNGYAMGSFVGDWLAGRQIPQVIQTKSVEMTDAASVTAFDGQLADPAAGFARALKGDEPSIGFFGQISYASKQDYLTNIIQGASGA